jgi:predicted transposase YdaD
LGKSRFTKGLQQGRQEGRREGEAEIVLRLLNRRFKHVSRKAEKQIREFSISQIEELTDALFDFETTKNLTAWLKEQADKERAN